MTNDGPEPAHGRTTVVYNASERIAYYKRELRKNLFERWREDVSERVIDLLNELPE